MFRFSALVLVIGFLGVSHADAQSFSGCGVLIGDASGFSSCVLLDAPGGPYQLTNLGGFGVGDQVYVEGPVSTIFATFCWDPVAEITVQVIDVCNPTTPFAECGTLIDSGACTLLETASGATYEVEQLGAFGAGDQVFVDGMLDASCVSACGATDGCITGNTIEPCPVEFQRADSNDDGALNIADAIYSLNWLFVPGSAAPDCMQAADANDDDVIDLADVVTTLNYLFVSGSLPMPSPDCGLDPTPGTLDCGASACP